MTEVRGLAATGARGGAMTERDSITGAPSPPRRDLGPDLVEDFRGFAALDAGDVVLVFQEDAERVVDGLRVEDERVDRKSVVWGKSVSVRVDLGGRRIIQKKKKNEIQETKC